MDSGAGRSSEPHTAGELLLDARLHGGAPWGFTMHGGLEHGAPLIISKLLLINHVELSGSRQEAVSLVKGSHRSLQLTVCSTQTRLPPEESSYAPITETSVNRRATGLLSKVLRFTTRRREPSRPHSWHSTKMGAAGGPDSSQLEELTPGGLDSHHTPWHHGYNQQQTSVSTTDLCVGWDSGFSYLRRSPDQYSSQGSLDSLDPPPLSSHSMDLLHSKRDSAYSSFSTSSSIPEYLASAPSLSSDRCCSLERVPQRAREGPRGHAGFMRSELTSAASLGNSLSQERGVSQQAKVSYTADVQLHTVVEKSPESSPTTRPRQWTASGLPQPSPPPRAPHTGPVPLGPFSLPCSQGPPALGAREALHQLQQDLGVRDGGEEEELKGWGKGENGYHSSFSSSAHPDWATSSSSFCPFRTKLQEADRAEDHHQVSLGVAQGQVAPARPPNTPLHPHPSSQQTIPAHPPPQPRPSPSSPAPRTWAQTQQEHPLTRLEMALTEVQRCASPDGSSQGSGSYGGSSQANTGGSQGSGRSLSVLEKVSRFERQEHGVKQHCLSSHSYSLQYKNEQSQSGKRSFCGMEDLRNMLERSGSKAHRTMSYKRSTSLLHHHTCSTTSQHFLEKRGPQTKPKPHCVVPSCSCSSSSPHTPRKMHIVSPSALPGVPPVGLAPTGRICGRRRLSVQQKKRSYSEPDCLHEVGVSDPETAALFRRGGGEGSVADRRRMFEVTAKSSSGDGPRPQSPPALRQVQQDVLALYIQRKREASSLFSTSSLLSLQAFLAQTGGA
ncbi:hypothetical protein CRUP_037858 [Coryphaenoides rupestris]|nr:hypothetical protein CRUP_037858 [Coryphaenoides rupestris]